MSTAHIPISDELARRVQAMRSRSWSDSTAAAFEAGEIATWAAGRGPMMQRRHPMARRREQRSPDRQRSYERRHKLAYSGPMPGHLAARFTVSAMAVMRIVADEHRTYGQCTLTLDEIAARAGVCRKTVQRSMKAVHDDGLITIAVSPRRSRKQPPNVVRIIDGDWLRWLRKGTATAGHLRPTTVNRLKDDIDDERSAVSAVASARGQPSKEAIAFAAELESIAGYRRGNTPQSWRDADPAQLVQVWISELAAVGVPASRLAGIAEHVMRRKPGRKPYSPRYFTPTIRKIVADVHRARTEPLPSFTRRAE